MKKKFLIVGLLVVVLGSGYYYSSVGGGDNLQGLLKKTVTNKKTTTTPIGRPVTSTETAPAVATEVASSPAVATPTVTMDDPGTPVMKKTFSVNGLNYEKALYSFPLESSDFSNTYLFILPSDWVKNIVANTDTGLEDDWAGSCYQPYTSLTNGLGLKCKLVNAGGKSFAVEYEVGKSNQYRVYLAILDASGKEVATTKEYHVP